MNRLCVMVMLVGGCEGISGALQPRSANNDCWSLDACSLATGSEIIADGRAFTDVDEDATIEELEIAPPGLIAATIAGDRSNVALHPLIAGLGHVHAVLRSGTATLQYDVNIRVADVSTTLIAPARSPAGVPASGDHIAAFAGSRIELSVGYLDATGQPMLGHGLENWATTTGTLVAAFADTTTADAALYRTIELGTESTVVTANGGQLVIDTLPAGSTETLALATDRVLLAGQPITISDTTRLDVIAETSNNQVILGQAPSGSPVVSVDDPTLVTFDVAGEELLPYTTKPGVTTLHLTFDGVTSTFPLSLQ